MSWIQNLNSLKKIALNNVIKNSYDYFLERCYRNYSTKYHTPLHTAKEILTAEEVILIHYEDALEKMSPEEVDSLKSELIDRQVVLSGDVKKLMQELDFMDDDAWIAQQTEVLKKQENENNKKTDAIKNAADEEIKKMREKMGLPSTDE